MASQVISKKQTATPVESIQPSGTVPGADWMRRLLATHPLAWASPWLALNSRSPRQGAAVQEDGDCLIVRAETPGHRLENLEVLANHHFLTIRSLPTKAFEPSTAKPSSTNMGAAKPVAGNGATHDAELPAVHVVIPLPEGADREKITATYSNGLLVVRVPKCQQGKSRKIPLSHG